MSCFSSSTLKDLASAAPFVITLTGRVNDGAAIEFISSFYANYFRSDSINEAFEAACDYIEYLGLSRTEINPVLTRRALSAGSSSALCDAPLSRADSILVDFSQVEGQVKSLGISRDRFVSLLTRKIRIHRWIFDQPSEGTLLSIGPYFGQFSWKNPNDRIVCYRISRVRENADEETCAAWADLLVAYNDLSVRSYRKAPDPASPQHERGLKLALEDLNRLSELSFCGGRLAPVLALAGGDQFKVTKALVVANLRQADLALHRGDLGRLVAYLEASLTAVHDLVDALSEKLTEPVSEVQ